MTSTMNAILITLTMGAAATEPVTAGQAETIRIIVSKMAFDPPRVTAHTGDTIEWVNSDTLPHTATGRHNEWDVMLPLNGSGRFTLKTAGEIDYYCRLHPNMTGHLSVTE